MTSWPTFLLLLVGVTYADDSVRLLDKSTTSITSSTLRWVHGTEAARYYSEMVRGAITRSESNDYAADSTTDGEEESEEDVMTIEVDEEPVTKASEESILVCRARHNGDLLPGAVINNECIVSLARQVAKYKRYDVLRNVEGSARLQWRHWTRFNGRPYGAVAADNLGYIARRRAGLDASQSYYLGRLDMSVGLGRVYVMEPEGLNWQEKDYLDGEVLVELEPVKYELLNVSFNQRRVKLQQKPRLLASTILRHESDEDQKYEDVESNDAIPAQLGTAESIATALTYWNDDSSEYWGQGRGMLRGLNTAIHMTTESLPRIIEWGVNKTHPGYEQAITVQAKLPPGTGQNVSVTGNHTYSETPYTGMLVAHYKDGKTRTRPINGTVYQVSLQAVKVTYGAHFFLHDGSLVPTTTTTTTTSTTPSTTTSSSTTTEPTTAKAAPASQELVKEHTSEVNAPIPQIRTAHSSTSSLTWYNSRQTLLCCVIACFAIAFRSGT